MINAYAAQSANATLTEYQYDPGELKPEEVEIEVMFCGICHSDLSMIDNEWGQSKFPLVAGHEVVGKVSQVGSQVKHLKNGQHVGLGWHSGYCNQCTNCDEGDHNLCSKAIGTIRCHHGGFADKVEGHEGVLIGDHWLERISPLRLCVVIEGESAVIRRQSLINPTE